MTQKMMAALYDRLMKKTLRAFNIAGSSTQTLEATEKALKKVSVRMNKQAGVKFYWRKGQDPDQYRVYRNDVNSSDKRSVDEICQQELKNAVCLTLKEQGALDSIKYGWKTGEIVQDAEKRFMWNA